MLQSKQQSYMHNQKYFDQSGRRGWLTPVLPHHRSCGSASCGSVTKEICLCLGLLIRNSSAVLPFTFGFQLILWQIPPFGLCASALIGKQSLSPDDRRVLSSACFHKLPRYYDQDSQSLAWLSSCFGASGTSAICTASAAPVPEQYRQPGGTSEAGSNRYAPPSHAPGTIPLRTDRFLSVPGASHTVPTTDTPVFTSLIFTEPTYIS